MESMSARSMSSRRRGPGTSAPCELGWKSSSEASTRIPSTNTSGPGSLTSVCAPRSRIRDPMPVRPDPGTTSKPAMRPASRSARFRTPRSRTSVVASITGRSTPGSLDGRRVEETCCWEDVAAPLSAELWAQSGHANKVKMSAAPTLGGKARATAYNRSDPDEVRKAMACRLLR